MYFTFGDGWVTMMEGTGCIIVIVAANARIHEIYDFQVQIVLHSK